jgi:hypothetical protein
MATKTIKTRIVNKHATELDWKKAINFVPLLGEFIIYDPDDTYFGARFKIGDGITNVNDLPFAGGSTGTNTIDAGSIADVTMGDSDFKIIDSGQIL